MSKRLRVDTADTEDDEVADISSSSSSHFSSSSSEIPLGGAASNLDYFLWEWYYHIERDNTHKWWKWRRRGLAPRDVEAPIWWTCWGNKYWRRYDA